MAQHTPIEWCDSAVNPVMGCDGCELWMPDRGVEHCYAGQLHKIRGGNPGYADKFDEPKMFPGRMAKAAAWSDLTGKSRDDKPWLNGQPRMIFISDMGDALSKDIPLEYLRDEVIGGVDSDKGKRHTWLWLTKQPHRMVKLADMIGGWPANLWAMTSVTSEEQLGRVRHLLRVPAKVRGVSYEPALGAVDFGHFIPHGLHWVIIGGESGPRARPFDLTWARITVAQCKAAGVAVFFKQMGTNPNVRGLTLGRVPAKGGEFLSIPQDLRIREFPKV